MSKRDELREKHRRSEQRNRIILIGVIVLIALGVVAAIAIPALTPAGPFKTITANPRPQAQGLSMGDPNAPIKVEEFSDYQCPYCQQFTQTLEPTIVDKYVKTGKVYFTYTPLSFIGPESVAAANASLCANDQGHFWDYHDILFANQAVENSGSFTDKRLGTFAQSIGLDMGKFNDCYSAKKFDSLVSQYSARGTQVGANSTPSFLVNGQLVHMDTVVDTIDKALAAVK